MSQLLFSLFKYEEFEMFDHGDQLGYISSHYVARKSVSGKIIMEKKQVQAILPWIEEQDVCFPYNHSDL